MTLEELIQSQRKRMATWDEQNPIPSYSSYGSAEPQRQSGNMMIPGLGLPTVGGIKALVGETQRRRGMGLPAFSTETVIENPQYPGVVGGIGRVAGALQGGIFGAAYGAIEPEESILRGAWKGFTGQRLVRFKYFIERFEKEFDVKFPESAKIAAGWGGDAFLDPLWLFTGPAALTKAGRATKLIESARFVEAAGEHAVDWTRPALVRAINLVGEGAKMGETWAEQAWLGQRAISSINGYPLIPREFSASVFQLGSDVAHKMAATRGIEGTLRFFGQTPNPEFNKLMNQSRYRQLFLERGMKEKQLEFAEIYARGKITPQENIFITRALETRPDNWQAFERDVLKQRLPVQEFIAKAKPFFDDLYTAQREAGVPVPYLGAALGDTITRLKTKLATEAEKSGKTMEQIAEEFRFSGKGIMASAKPRYKGFAFRDIPELERKLAETPQFVPHIRGQLAREMEKRGWTAAETEIGGKLGLTSRVRQVKYGNMLHREMEGSIAQINDQMLELARKQYPDMVAQLERRSWKDAILRREADPARLEYFQTNPMALTGQYGAAAVRAMAASEFLGYVGERWAKPVKEVTNELQRGDWMRVAAKELDGLALPRPLARMVDEHYKALTNDVVTKGVLRVYDEAMSYFRGISLMAPSYHVRNVLGGNMMHGFVHGGTRDYKSYRTGLALAAHYAGEGWAGNTGKWSRNWADMALSLDKIKLTGRSGTVTGRELFKIAKENGWFGEGFTGSMVAGSAATTFGTKQNREMAVLAENICRAAHGVDRILKGDTGYQAGRSIGKFFFNYSEMGTWERELGRRLVFFYGWPRNNFILHARRMLEYPAHDLKTAQMISRAQTSPLSSPEELTPKWIREQIGVPVKKDASGTSHYFMLSNWIPEADIYRMAEMFKQEKAGAIPKLFASYIVPPVRWAIEQLTNKQMYFDRKIEEFPGESIAFWGVPMNKRVAYLLSQVRFLNEIDRLNPGNVFSAQRYGMTEISPEMKFPTMLAGRAYPVEPWKEFQRTQWNKKKHLQDLDKAIRGAAREGDEKLWSKYLKDKTRFLDEEMFS